MALEEPDDVTQSAVTAGEEEAFSSLEDRAIAPGPGDPAEQALILSFFPTAEGYYDYENFRYIYQLKDHLGNVRISYTKEENEIKIMDKNDYYPFGMNFLKSDDVPPVYDPLAIPYNYKYNGKELQETGMYDYGARFYMPDIGRWGVVDPLAEKYPDWTPYAFTANNPLRFREVDGRYFEEGSKSAKQANKIESRADKQANKLEQQANRLDAKGKSTGDLRDRATELRQSAQDVRNMRDDQSTEYKYARFDGKEGKSLGLVGPSTTLTGQNSNGDNVVTMFTESNMGNQLHETRHGGQNARGEYNIGTGAGYGVADEVSAYRAQYSWNGSLKFIDVNKTPTQAEILNSIQGGSNPLMNTINTINKINANFVNSLVDPGFVPIYPPTSIPLNVWNSN
jgi:RHS repeat-associated protein